jgi:hypothetical protein
VITDGSVSFTIFSLLGVLGLSLLGVEGFSLIGEARPSALRIGLDDAEFGGLLASGKISAPGFNEDLDGLDLSHGLDAFEVSDSFRIGTATSFTACFGGTFGGTSGGLVGERGEICTAVVGVVPSAGEKIGDSGLVGLYGAIARTS